MSEMFTSGGVSAYEGEMRRREAIAKAGRRSPMTPTEALRAALRKHGKPYLSLPDEALREGVVAVLEALQADLDIRISVANAVGSVIRDLAVRHVQRERAGSSASMNPSLEYVELNVVTTVIDALIAQERGN